MEKKQRKPRSLRTGLLTTILICWVLPIVIVVAMAGVLLNASYERSVRQELETEAGSALEQLSLRLAAAFEASRSVSYDGVVRNAYRAWQQDGDSVALYRAVTENLTQNFARQENIQAVFLSFWEDTGVHPYVTTGRQTADVSVRRYRAGAEAALLAAMADVDTEILLLDYGGELYLCRNLLDSRFAPYATVVMYCDRAALFRPLDGLNRLGEVSLVIDGELLRRPDGGLDALSGDLAGDRFSAAVDGHSLALYIRIAGFDIWAATPGLRPAVWIAILLVVPMLLTMLLVFRRQIAEPVETLVDATARVQQGERGYRIERRARNVEFQKLFRHFNSMSGELKEQFDRSVQEQQALRRAEVKALQSQINPHFLNNTLEIINWEARLADDERVSAMIEALSTMLDAALDRDGRGQVRLREELGYVDAYLYIIRERLGEKLIVERNVDGALLDRLVPRLILQPIVENAVEHDVTPRRGGRLRVGAAAEAGRLVLSVEHDGALSPEDRETLGRILSTAAEAGADGAGSRVGLRNVRERLWLLYGEAGTLTVEQAGPDIVRAAVSFPLEPA